METLYAFYSALAETLVLGSHHVTNDGRKYTALFTSLEQADMYLWKDKEFVGTITEYGTPVITDKDQWNNFFNKMDYLYTNEEEYRSYYDEYED